MVFFLIILLVYVGINVWLFYGLLQAVAGLPLAAKWAVGIVYWALAFSLMLMQVLRDKDLSPTLGNMLYRISTGWPGFFFYLALFYAVASLLRLTGVQLPHAFASCAGLTVLLLTYGYIHFRHPVVRQMQLELPHPNSDTSPLRIVAVSDIHLGYGIGRSRLRTFVDRINAEHPDLILIAGDLIDMSIVPLKKERMHEELSRLEAPLGIYMVPGNHEYISGIEESTAFINRTPVTLLRDSMVLLPGGIQLIGRDDASNRRRKPLKELLASVNPHAPVFVMDHQPANETVSGVIDAGVDFAFFGHTHRGQLWPLSWLTDALYTQSHGYRSYGRTHIYVSSGLGLWGPPFRIGTDSELGVIEIP
ncbi:MAG: metallophosphoesterase [Mediterranea sp.]|jgi:predicted MPP superfamily phosphohydrolase|nr:metallophosphoesterase [Mediterranea sp.]